MISFNERLRWMKYSNYFMAITQQAWVQHAPMGNASAMASYPVNPLGSAGMPPLQAFQTTQAQTAQGQVVRVPARVIRLPNQQPVAGPTMTSADFIDPTAPQTSMQSGPVPSVETAESVQPMTPAPQPEIQQPIISPPESEMQPDPYNDLAEALAEGLTQTPPEGQSLPPYIAAPEVDQPQVTRPGKRASFAEALAMNSDQPTNQSPSMPTSIPPKRPQPEEASNEASATMPSTSEADPVVDVATPEQAESTDATAKQEAKAITSESSEQAPNPEVQTSEPPSEQNNTESSVQQSEPSAEPDPTDDVSVKPVDTDLAEAEANSSEEAINAAQAEVPNTDIDQQEQEEQKRKELEALLRATNNGEPVRLPRLPRPKAPPKPQKKVEEDNTPPVAEVPPEVAQNLLARLNRLAEMENSGEAEGGMPMPYSKLENWQDHNPSENVEANEQSSESAPTPSVSAIPEIPSAQPSAKPKRSAQANANSNSAKTPKPRLKAKPVSSKRGKGAANKQQSVRQANQAKGDQDDEAERGAFTPTHVPTLGPEGNYLSQSQIESPSDLTTEIAEAFAQTTGEVAETRAAKSLDSAVEAMAEHAVQQTQAQQVPVISPTPEFGETAEQTQSNKAQNNAVRHNISALLRRNLATNTPESKAPIVPMSGSSQAVQRVPVKLVNVFDTEVRQKHDQQAQALRQNLVPEAPTLPVADFSQQNMSQVNPVSTTPSFEQQVQSSSRDAVPVAPQSDLAIPVLIPAVDSVQQNMAQANLMADAVADNPITQHLVAPITSTITPQPVPSAMPVAAVPYVDRGGLSQDRPSVPASIPSDQPTMPVQSMPQPIVNTKSLAHVAPVIPPTGQSSVVSQHLAPIIPMPINDVVPVPNYADQSAVVMPLNTNISAPAIPVMPQPSNPQAIHLAMPGSPTAMNLASSALTMPSGSAAASINTTWSRPVQPASQQILTPTSAALLGQPAEVMPMGMMSPQPTHSGAFPVLPINSVNPIHPTSPISKAIAPNLFSETPASQPQIPQLATEAIEAEGHGQPLPLGVQEALQHTLGTSVKNIRVVRNPQVGAALEQAKAEALTVDQTVLLPEDIDLETPAGHALAAHEYTHALRKTQPQFVPEVLRRQQQNASQSPVSALTKLTKAQSEEEVALATEHAAHQEFSQQRGLSRPAPSSNQATQPYNGLPAPHEPMPFWSDQADQASSLVNTPSWMVSEKKEAAPAETASTDVMPPLSPDALAAQGIFAADRERPKPAASPPQQKPEQKESDSPVGNKSGKTPSQDLDHLAHDVYNRLRDRLSDELRRLRNS